MNKTTEKHLTAEAAESAEKKKKWKENFIKLFARLGLKNLLFTC